jgi:hypothetical protein
MQTGLDQSATGLDLAGQGFGAEAVRCPLRHKGCLGCRAIAFLERRLHLPGFVRFTISRINSYAFPQRVGQATLMPPRTFARLCLVTARLTTWVEARSDGALAAI